MACALTVLAVLALPLQAQTEIWSATFTPAALGSGFIGCGNEIGNILRACSTAAVLSDDDFTHDSTDYSVTAFFLSSGRLTLTLDTDITTTATNGLTLVVGSTSFAFAAASFTARSKIWTSPGLSWTAGTAIDVKLTAATPPVTNTPATGAPTITGTAQVGQTLTAVTTGITDADGLTSPTYTYQWIRVDGGTEADISSANSSTYTLVDADLGKTLTVRVRFDDDAGNTETLTSAATATVVAAATAPTVSAVAVTSSPASGDTYGTGEMIRFTVTFDQDVTVTGTPEFEFCLGSSSTVSCSVGTPPPALRSAALSSGSGTTALVFSYTVVAGDMDTDGIWIGNHDRTIKLDAADAIQCTVGGLDAVLTHAEVGGQTGHKVNGAAANTAATGAPTITGTAQVGQTLTAVTTGITDADGLTSPTYTYQWIRVDGGTEADISSANSSTYTLVDADLGKTLTVRVRFDDDAGNTETLTSAATATVVAAATAPTVSAVAVTSSPASGDTYGTGEMIRFTVTFDQSVTVTGTPEFEFCLGNSGGGSCTEGSPPPTRRRAALSSGSGTTALVFSYTVVAGDMDDNGIWIGDQGRTIKLDAADAIRGTGGGRARCRAHPRGGGRPERPQGQWRDDHQHPRDGRADHHGHGAGGPDADGGHHRHHG